MCFITVKHLVASSTIYECPECLNRDCELNIEGCCHRVSTILERIPGGFYTCNDPICQDKLIQENLETFDFSGVVDV